MTLTPASVALHDPKNDVAPHFDYLDVWNARVPLKMPLASHDASASVSHEQKSHVILHFNGLDLRNIFSSPRQG